MKRENTMGFLSEHARTGSAKGCRRASNLIRRGLNDLRSLNDAPLVAFDVLAAGCDQDIIEIGAVRYENGVEVGEFSTFVNPGRDVLPEELEGSGITPGMFADAPGLADVIPAFDGFLQNAVLAAHSDSYNVWMLSKAYEKVGGALVNPTIDTISCSWRLFDVLRRRYPYPDYLMIDFMTPAAEPYRAVESARFCGTEFLMAFEEVGAGWDFS